MRGGRKSLIVRAGRLFQEILPLLRFMDYPFRTPFLFRENQSHIPAVFIIAPPRSGSTLTYQLLCNCFENEHLTNFSNLLYATPVMGSLISNNLCKDYQTDFKSEKGFVSGLCGEAEGLRFWEYWAGQGLVESRGNHKVRKLKKLEGLLSKLHSLDNKVYISGYLGHVFCVDLLREVFPNSVFIHLERNILDNVSSILRVSSDGNFSLQPKSIEGFKGSREERVVRQVITIQSLILDNEAADTIRIHYEDLCNHPLNIIEEIRKFAEKQGVSMNLSENIFIPEKFRISKVDKTSEENKRLYEIIQSEISTFSQGKRKYFEKLL